MLLPKFYYNSIKENALLEAYNGKPFYVCASSNLFSERSLFHKIARTIYKVFRAFYVTVIFYFAPLSVLVINFFLTEVEKHQEVHAHTS